MLTVSRMEALNQLHLGRMERSQMLSIHGVSKMGAFLPLSLSITSKLSNQKLPQCLNAHYKEIKSTKTCELRFLFALNDE